MSIQSVIISLRYAMNSFPTVVSLVTNSILFDITVDMESLYKNVL